MADDAATLRAAAAKFGIALPQGDRSVDSEAHAFAKSLERGGVGGQMSAGMGQVTPAAPKFATIPEHVIPAVQPLPPPMAPGDTVGAPDPVAYARQRAQAQAQAMDARVAALRGQPTGFAAIPTGTILQGGALPPPVPPGQPSLAPTPQELAAFKTRLGPNGEHCKCEEKA